MYTLNACAWEQNIWMCEWQCITMSENAWTCPDLHSSESLATQCRDCAELPSMLCWMFLCLAFHSLLNTVIGVSVVADVVMYSKTLLDRNPLLSILWKEMTVVQA